VRQSKKATQRAVLSLSELFPDSYMVCSRCVPDGRRVILSGIQCVAVWKGIGPRDACRQACGRRQACRRVCACARARGVVFVPQCVVNLQQGARGVWGALYKYYHVRIFSPINTTLCKIVCFSCTISLDKPNKEVYNIFVRSVVKGSIVLIGPI
jgi:hypothetical protein